jgi:hypothetical protein
MAKCLFTWIQQFLSRESKLFVTNSKIDRCALVLAVLSNRSYEMANDVVIDPPTVEVLEM